MKNNYLCHNIKFVMATVELSPKIKSLLVRRFNLVNDAQIIEKAEEAIMAYYNLSLVELQPDEDCVYDAYVYIYFDKSVKGNWHLYGKEYCEYLPLYVGKGQGDRSNAHVKYCKNSELDIALNKIRKQGSNPEIRIYNKGCTDLMAFNLESYIIARLREQGVRLCNATTQKISSIYDKEFVVSTFNIEKLEANLIIEALNDVTAVGGSDVRKRASDLLGMCERTLYRKMKSLGIIRVDNYYTFKDNLADVKTRHDY